MVLRLGDDAGGGEGGGVGAGGGGWIGAAAWMAIKMMRWYQLPGSVYYSGNFWFQVGHFEQEGAGEKGGGGGRNELELRHGLLEIL